MTTRMDSLIGNSYSIVKFADLPASYQMAIVWRSVMECEAWGGVEIPEWKTEDEAKAGLAPLLPKYVELYGEIPFGMTALSAEALKSAVMQDEDIASSYATWEEYHAFYTHGPIPAHPEANRWPVTLSFDDYETLLDGWHRFHSYIRDGALEIPAFFYPSEHHLESGPSAADHSSIH